MELNNRLALIISLSCLLFFNSAESICVPRNLTHLVPSPPPRSPPPSQPTPSSPAPVSSPAPQPTPSSPPLVSPTPPKPAPSSPSSPPATPPSIPPISSPLSPAIELVLKTICASTDYPDLCLSSLSPFLTGNLDLVSILETAIKACTHHAENATAEATKIALDPTTPATTVSYLQSCKDSYDDALDNLEAAADAIKARDIGTINSMLSAALTDFGSCDEGFAETPGGKSPMADIDDMLGHLASNCLALASLLKWA